MNKPNREEAVQNSFHLSTPVNLAIAEVPESRMVGMKSSACISIAMLTWKKAIEATPSRVMDLAGLWLNDVFFKL